MNEPTKPPHPWAGWAVETLGKPGARTWFVLVVVALYFGLWLFGFDNVMDRIGLTRDVPPIEQLRSPEESAQ